MAGESPVWQGSNRPAHADQPYHVGFRTGEQVGLDPNGHAKGMTGRSGT
jgi:hypothetical protein